MEMRKTLEMVRSGQIGVAEAERRLRLNALAAVGTNLTLDLGRQERTGVPEVVLAEGKDAGDVVEATRTLVEARGMAIVTRCPDEVDLSGCGARQSRHACGTVVVEAEGFQRARTGGRVALMTAGASDAMVAQEAQVVADALGADVIVERDMGVASLARAVEAAQRLLAQEPHVWIVIAGREGALAPVVAGLVPGPVIGVPVSTGYGFRGRGEAALSTMLQACTPLLTVNIDAGFVAGAAAAQIAARAARE